MLKMPPPVLVPGADRCTKSIVCPCDCWDVEAGDRTAGSTPNVMAGAPFALDRMTGDVVAANNARMQMPVIRKNGEPLIIAGKETPEGVAI
jgi:hypothetical protein